MATPSLAASTTQTNPETSSVNVEDTAATQTSPETSNVNVEDTAAFQDMCNGFFERNGLAFDKAGQDVTTSFYNAYYESYINGDYATLNQAFIDQLSYVEYDASDSSGSFGSSISPMSLMHRTYNREQCRLITNTGKTLAGVKWYLVVTLSFTYNVYDGTFQIFDVGTPTVAHEFSGLGAAFSGSFTSTSIDGPTYTNNHRSVQFSVNLGTEVSASFVGCPPVVIHSSMQNFTFHLNGNE